MATVIIVALLAGALVFAIRRALRSMRSGCCGDKDCEKIKEFHVSDRNPAHYNYRKKIVIDGMTCRNCQIHVQNALNRLDGVFAQVRLDKREAIVSMKRDLPDGELLAAISRSGYTGLSITDCQGPSDGSSGSIKTGSV